MKLPPGAYRQQLTAAAAAAFAVILALGVLLIGGCGTKASNGAKAPGTATATNGEAATLLKQATDVMRKVTGMHFDKDSDLVPVDAFFEKPVKPEELLRKLQELLGKKGA